MSITNEDIKAEWEPGDTLVVTMDGDGDGTDGDSSDGGDTDGTDAGDTDGTDSGDTDGTDG